MYYTNCRSLNAEKLEDLKLYVSRYHPDIISLTETWFTIEREHNTNVPGYTAYTANRKIRIGGGVAIFLRSNINGKVIEHHTTTTLSAVWLLIRHPGMPTMIIGCVYSPPRDNNSDNLRYIEDTLSKLVSSHNNAKVILVGDFNQIPLDFLCSQFNLQRKIDFSTRGNVILDQILTDVNNYSVATKLTPLIGNENDHCGVFLDCSKVRKSQYTSVTRRKITPTAKQQVIIDIATQDWSEVTNTQCIHAKTAALNTVVFNILDTHCPLKTYKTRADKPHSIDPLLLKVMRARDRAYRKNHPSWRFLSIIVKKQLRKRRKQYVKTKLNQATSSKAWWASLREIEGKQVTEVSRFHLIDDKWLSTDQFVERLNDYFISVGGNRNPENAPCIPSSELDKVSIGEVKTLLRNIDHSKSTNGNDFPAWISKLAFEDMCIPVTDILNCMLETNVYPDIWKTAEIRPIKKVKNPTKLSEYRPISLLHHLGKVAEEIILKRLRSSIGNKLQKNQYAYQAQISTVDALLHLIHNWCQELDNSHTSHITTVFIDMSKAFDRMDPNLLIQKLSALNVNSGLIKLIDNFLTNRKCSVKLLKSSEYKDISMGAPQGTKLGPWLWLVYINDLKTDSPMVKYADDISVYRPFSKSRSDDRLQTALDSISDWADQNNMLINAGKTNMLNLTLSQPKYTTVLDMNNQAIESCHSAKLLGVIVDEKLNFSEHVDNMCSKMGSRLYGMRSLKKLGLNSTGLLKYYTANIRSALTYACPAWSSLITQVKMNQIIQIERRALKIANPSISYEEACKIHQLNPINTYMEDISIRHINNIFNNPDHPLNELLVKNNFRQTRVSQKTRMHTCRTAKLQNSFLYKYAKFL